MPAVNPEILIWARETAALELEEAAKKLGFKDSTTSAASEKLKLLESGQRDPSRAQLNGMSKVYHQPLLAFYLPNPPIRGDRGEDFRTIPQQTLDRKGNAHLNFLMRDVKAAQNLVRDLLEEEKSEPLPFIGSAAMSSGYYEVAQDIVEELKFDLRLFRDTNNVRDAFSYLRERIEGRGIFVLLKSDLGSHHTAIPVEVFRGFAFADPFAPFIVINRQDTIAAWSFTALYEVAHLWLGSSGVSGKWGEYEIDRFCNQVAGAILLPPDELRIVDINETAGFDELAHEISTFAYERSISPAMVAYNLLLIKKINEEQWRKLNREFQIDRRRNNETKHASQQSQKGGPSYYAVLRHQLGNPLIEIARRHIQSRSLTPTKAAVILGVAPTRVYPLLFPEYA